MATPPFRKKFRGPVRTDPRNIRVKLEVRSLTVLVLLAFNAQEFKGHVTLDTPPFSKNVKCPVSTVPGNIRVIFEVRSFNRFGVTST